MTLRIGIHPSREEVTGTRSLALTWFHPGGLKRRCARADPLAAPGTMRSNHSHPPSTAARTRATTAGSSRMTCSSVTRTTRNPRRCSLASRRVRVLTLAVILAVHLDHDLGGRCEEVHDETPHDHLPLEQHALDLPTPQRLPQPRFAGRRPRPLLSCVKRGDGSFSMTGHIFPPRPAPAELCPSCAQVACGPRRAPRAPTRAPEGRRGTCAPRTARPVPGAGARAAAR